jgi:hypothetical protein
VKRQAHKRRESRKRILPVHLDIQGDITGARILYPGWWIVFRMLAPGIVGVDLPGVPTRVFDFSNRSAPALRAEVVEAGDLWLSTFGGCSFLGAPPTGEDFGLAWDRHRRLWLEANAT